MDRSFLVMDQALAAYLSDMSETDKLAAVRACWASYAVVVDSMTGSSIVQSWDEDSQVECAFINANWI